MGVSGIDWRGLNLDFKQSGSTIGYRDGGPQTGKMCQEQLLEEGAELNLP